MKSIYTDGSCSGNPGIGGFGYVIVDDKDKIIKQFSSGPQENTTNNAEELKACILACDYILDYEDRYDTYNIYTDSIYVYKGITEWIKTWSANNWCKANGNNIKNQGLWQVLNYLASPSGRNLKLNWHWIKGHNNNKWNDFADKLATDRTTDNTEEINSVLSHYLHCFK